VYINPLTVTVLSILLPFL